MTDPGIVSERPCCRGDTITLPALQKRRGANPRAITGHSTSGPGKKSFLAGGNDRSRVGAQFTRDRAKSKRYCVA